MKTLNLKLGIIFSLLLFYNAGCSNKGTSTGNPLVTLNITGSSQNASTFAKNYKRLWWLLNTAVAFPPPNSMQDSSNLSVSLSELWLNAGEFELKFEETAQSGEVPGAEVEFKGPYIVNLFSNSPMTLATAAVAQTSMRRLKYKTQRVDASNTEAPVAMIGASIYLTGNVNGNAFEFKSEQEIAFETSGPNLVSFAHGDNLLLQLQTADLIRNINLSAVSNGVVISENNRVSFANACPNIDASASDLYTCFIKGLQKMAKVGNDDGDFVFENGEETVN